MSAKVIVILSIFALVVIFALIYIIIGEICFRISLSRKAFAGLVVNKEINNEANEFKIDYEWWNKMPFSKVCVIGYGGIKLYPHFLKNGYSKRVAILIHGYLAPYQFMSPYAQMFLDMGYSIVVTQNRAHGESEGKFVGMGWLDRLDILETIKTTIKKFGDDCEIVVFGISMGGATVCMLSGEDLPQNVTHLISDCAYTSVYDVFSSIVLEKTKLPLPLTLFLFNSYCRLRCGYYLKEADARLQLAKDKLPILFIHGSADKTVPYYMMEDLYNATPKDLRTKKTFLEAGHALSLPKNETEYKQLIKDFLN